MRPCDVCVWPEAAVHRVAATRPQLEHKPTWHGLVNVRLHSRYARLSAVAGAAGPAA
jgi:hypothetical protein